MIRLSRFIQYISGALLGVIVLGIMLSMAINAIVLVSTQKKIVKLHNIQEPLDAVVVLGASVVWLQLSPILQDRVETAIRLYQEGKTKKIVISGDNGKKYYNEVDAMENYLRNRWIPTTDIIADKKWFNTFESIYNIWTITNSHNLEKIGVVTQDFHLPRALFIATSLGIDAVGISSDRASYNKKEVYEKREFLARIKSVFDIIQFHITH